MFGLGGVFVESLKDVTFRVAPFGVEEAHRDSRDQRLSNTTGYAVATVGSGFAGRSPIESVGVCERAICKVWILIPMGQGAWRRRWMPRLSRGSRARFAIWPAQHGRAFFQTRFHPPGVREASSSRARSTQPGKTLMNECPRPDLLTMYCEETFTDAHSSLRHLTVE